MYPERVVYGMRPTAPCTRAIQSRVPEPAQDTVRVVREARGRAYP